MRKARRTAVPFTLLFLLLWQGHLPGACKEESFAGRLFRPAYAAEPDATLHYFGHSFFQLVTSRGTRVVMDPLAPGWYPVPDISADVVTIGREHQNHNWFPIVRGRPMILRGLRETLYGYDWNTVRTTVKDVLVQSVPIYVSRPDGDIFKGAAFTYDLGRLCVAHLGDLSHKLTPKQLKQFGKVDVALVPIGGRTTMGAYTAREVVGSSSRRSRSPCTTATTWSGCGSSRKGSPPGPSRTAPWPSARRRCPGRRRSWCWVTAADLFEFLG